MLSGFIYQNIATADEQTASNQKAEGRYSTPVGPFYDSVFDLAIAVIPTVLYETSPNTRTSATKFNAIYGSNQNWSGKLDTETYLGKDNQYLVDMSITYTDAKLDIENFMRHFDKTGSLGISQSPVEEIQLTSLNVEAIILTKLLKDYYWGLSLSYAELNNKKNHLGTAFSTANMRPNEVKQGIGFALRRDARNSILSPTRGFYVNANVSKIDAESKSGGIFPLNVQGTEVFTLNGEDSYRKLALDFRYYYPFTSETTLALRMKAELNSDGAPKTATELSKVAHGFTFEVGGRSAIGSDLQLRHWITPEVGLVTSIGAAKALHNSSGKDELHYTAGFGFRYMLKAADKLSLRLDLQYNDQESDNFLVYFNVGEVF